MEIKAIYVDMDGTAVSYETGDFHSSWDALGHSLCDRQDWDAGTKRYYPHPDLYEEWISYNARLLKGKTIEQAEQALFPNGELPYNLGFKEFFLEARDTFSTGIISSGVDLVAAKIVEDLKLSFFIANQLEVVNQRFTGIAHALVPLWAKQSVVAECAERSGIALENVCFVGDNENDLPVLEVVGLPILFVSHLSKISLAHRLVHQARTRNLQVIDDFRELWEVLRSCQAT